MYDLKALIEQMGERTSDLHITTGLPPMYRRNTRLFPGGEEKLTPDMTKNLIYSVLSQEQIARFERDLELDMAFGVEKVGRLRMNVFRQRGSVAAALRLIPTRMWQLDELHLPNSIYEIVNIPKGLVLVTGETGSGKSTTLAAMINYINENRSGHIITVEDPIEYIHKNKNCMVNQRELGSDTYSFNNALKYVLRQDPDIILIGEMRDLETIEAAAIIAETGHLVFATLHTMDAASSINRMIDVFPPHQQGQIRAQLSVTVQAVISQQLLPNVNGDGMTLSAEIMMATSAIRSLIREMRTEQIYSQIQMGASAGMQTMNMSLAKNVIEKRITKETALEYSTKKDELEKLLVNIKSRS
ncbi:MAG: type IV pilus twitching motility protein PilT [Endomicrobia bacterium]|nr:type IV pilus twitching motility protein PilT [Endomicrobiia bacterium]MCL2798886.1 type IV pilus twitching motility protein PilT [Endomicrobiia bacterium]